jgi:hypothetical protein
MHQCWQPSIKKVTTTDSRTSQQSDASLLTRVGIDYPFCKMNIQPPRHILSPLLLSEFGVRGLSLKKVQRRCGSRRGDGDDDERRRGAKQRTTPYTRDRGEPKSEAVPQLDPHAWRRDGGKKGDDDECRIGARQWWSEPNAEDEGPWLDPLGFWWGAKQQQAGACQWGGEVGEGSASRLQAHVSGNNEEGSRERRRWRGDHLWLWQRPQRRRGKFLWISLPFYLFYRWSLS